MFNYVYWGLCITVLYLTIKSLFLLIDRFMLLFHFATITLSLI